MGYTERQLSEMMRDPRYWRDRDPEMIREVTEGFEELYPNCPPASETQGRAVIAAELTSEMCMLEAERAETRFRQSTDDVARRHDEAMRMQALMFGAYMVGGDTRERDWVCAQEWAAKAYREATGREW